MQLAHACPTMSCILLVTVHCMCRQRYVLRCIASVALVPTEYNCNSEQLKQYLIYLSLLD